MVIERPIKNMTMQDLQVYAYALCSVAQTQIQRAKDSIRDPSAVPDIKIAIDNLERTLELLDQYYTLKRKDIQNHQHSRRMSEWLRGEYD